ncbi:MAG: type IV toxin-antitoxin system AbiEi family antitoxin domain-containing protein, partial [Actinobacteria bacterium]|nr:type IV toxin-antitoxin system AbiEi family antitoxin domain-containing protein [Actinomycetota bacterium]
MITTAQAVAAGVDRTTLIRLIDAGLLESPARGVYVVPAASPTHIEERAAWLRLEPRHPAWQRQPLDSGSGVVSHCSAAKIHGLGDLTTDGVDITVPRRRTTRDPHVRLRRGALTPDEVTVVDGLPVTTVERTILDLLADHVDGGHVGDVIADAMRRNDIDLDTLATKADPHAAKYDIRGRDGHT